MNLQRVRLTAVPSPFGELVIAWHPARSAGNSADGVPDRLGPQVQAIFLPRGGIPARDRAAAAFPAIEETLATDPQIDALADQLHRFLEGEAVTFDLHLLALETCTPFQQQVLRAEAGIPRGCVSTYARIAAHLGVPNGARAVGNALATNPFPIVIPCHRAIRSDGTLGGYQGGMSMKRALLAYEGVAVAPEGRVIAPRLYY